MALKSSLLSFRRNWRKTSSRFFTSRGPRTIRADFCRDTKARISALGGLAGCSSASGPQTLDSPPGEPAANPEVTTSHALLLSGPSCTWTELSAACPVPTRLTGLLCHKSSLLREDIRFCLLYVQMFSAHQSLSCELGF